MKPLRALLDTEPPELELTVIELDDGEMSFAMVLRDSEHSRGGHKDITAYGGWRAYRASVPPPPEDAIEDGAGDGIGDGTGDGA
jgi:hypothetical protein